MLGDADDWEDDEQGAVDHRRQPGHGLAAASGSLVLETEVGNLLIQFHIGNLPYELTHKSQRLFATQVAPRLRDKSRVIFAKHFKELEHA